MLGFFRNSSRSYQDAYRELLNMGLKPTVPTYENDEEVEANHIISFTPYEKTPLSPGTEIHMVVSKGPEKKPFPMPDLREMLRGGILGHHVSRRDGVVVDLNLGALHPAGHQIVHLDGAQGLLLGHLPEIRHGEWFLFRPLVLTCPPPTG